MVNPETDTLGAAIEIVSCPEPIPLPQAEESMVKLLAPGPVIVVPLAVIIGRSVDGETVPVMLKLIVAEVV